MSEERMEKAQKALGISPDTRRRMSLMLAGYRKGFKDGFRVGWEEASKREGNDLDPTPGKPANEG